MSHVEGIQDDIVQDLKEGITYEEFDNLYGINKYYAGKVMDEIEEDTDYTIGQKVVDGNGKKEFYIQEQDSDENGLPVDERTHNGKQVNHTKQNRMKTKSKQSITRKANKFLTKLEEKVKTDHKTHEPSEPITYTNEAEDIVIHRTDDHFGQIEHDIQGNVVYNSEIAEKRVEETFDKAIEHAQKRIDMGNDIENIHLLLGGDHVTNEAIYEGQPYDIDELITAQLDRATRVYDKQIERLADKFDHVQVVCQAGNHGEFRVKGSSKEANADDIFYQMLEKLATKGGYDNVSFVKSDRKDHVNFEMRGHTAHLRHGQHVRNHIGTSSPKSDWLSFLNEYDFDVAFRGHYHEHKIEHVNGVPVIMSPSIKPPGEYEGSLAIFGQAMSYIIGVTDDMPVAWTEYVRYED